MIAQTPQRPLPGAYIQTPAASRFQSRQPFARTPSSSAQQQNASQSIQQQSRQNARPTAKSPAETLAPVDRALRTINDTLISESRYPELDTYLG
ncbi:hypothetical protein MMC14_003596, partial [Varicellaria rhodocarpa]|nr:hypothetical protein [Varicellaria rhodocarpa]